MIKIVNWNVGKREKPWHELVRMARNGDADVALLQEAGSPPGDLVDLVEDEDRVFWNRHLYDRWPLVVKLSDQLTVTQYRQVAPISNLGADALGVSGIGTIAAARVIPHESEEEAFIAVSMYARWLKPHPSTKSSWSVGCSGRFGPSDHFGPVGIHRPPRPCEAQDSGGGGSEHVLRGDWVYVVTSGTRAHGMGSHAGAWPGVSGSAGAARPARGICASRRTLRHEERADRLLRRGQARNRCESTGLRVRITRVPQEGVGTSDEPCWRVGTERSLPPDDRG